MDKKKFDFIILGGGPGGYVAAIRAAKSGGSVALIESKDLGGTCLNRGCIPSKAHIANSEHLRKVKESSTFGISVKELSIDYSIMKKRVDKTVSSILKGLTGLIKANKITLFQGKGSFISNNEIKVSGSSPVLLEGKILVIATGSEPKNIAAFPFDNERILSSTSLLEKKELPQSLVIIGGGVIGSEFASLYNELGVKVTILEALPEIIPMEAPELSKELAHSFKKRGIQVETGVFVEQVKHTKSGVAVFHSNGNKIEAEWALVAIGRKLNSNGIGLEHTGVSVTPQGAIQVNAHMQTDTSHIYAIGDITAKSMLAHVASHQGIVAIEHALGKENAVMHYNAIPSVIYTYPEVASVGLTLEQSKEQGIKAKASSFPFKVLGKSQATGETEGFAQLIIEENTEQILGAQVIGSEAASLIAEIVISIQNELTLSCLKDTIHAHPTFSESWLEAGFLADGIPIHLPPIQTKKK